MLKCPNCGSIGQFKEYGKTEVENTMVQIYICGCGYHHQVFWKKDLEAGYLNNVMIYRKKNENK